MATKTTEKKYVYSFGGGKADGNESMKNLLGGKGANLAEMAGHPQLKLPVPPGFTITTEVCTYYYDNERTYPVSLNNQIKESLGSVEKIMGKKFGDVKNPLLLSVRSGARKSMPGMMDTVLNVGLTEKTIQGLIDTTGDARFAYDAYRRLIMMYADVVMEKAGGGEELPKTKGIKKVVGAVKKFLAKPEQPIAEGKGIRKIMDERLEEVKKAKGYKEDTDLTVEDLKSLVVEYKKLIRKHLNKEFPEDPWGQLMGGVGAVFASWNGKRAVEYRRIEKIPDDWGTAVNVQAMVFGNMGSESSTGVAFTRNPGNGDNHFYGEYLVNAQGEDVVAGIRTPSPINEFSKNDHSKNLVTLEKLNPKVYEELFNIQKRLEQHYRDMQDIEFTVEKGKLYMLQCRLVKINGAAAVRMAADMYKEKLIDGETAIQRVNPNQLVELLLPMIDPKAEAATKPIAKGLPAGPGGAIGRVVFTSEEAVAWAAKGEKVILVREETSPEDVDGMHKAQAILTSKGGMTSHAALVARGWGKCCIVGCSDIEIDSAAKTLICKNGHRVKEGDWISLNGTKGLVYEGKLALTDVDLGQNKAYTELMQLVDKYKTIGVRTNADTPKDAAQAIAFGAEGIGLFRTEHMFYGEGSDKPLFLLRKMIMSNTEAERRSALGELFDFVKKDMKDTMAVMKGKPVTIRLLDPPLHEFVPHDTHKLHELATALNINMGVLQKRIDGLKENNPMLGHRGVRLGVTYPEVTEMQIRAILEAAGELNKENIKALPEIMVPVTFDVSELNHQKVILDRVYKEVCKKLNVSNITYLYGTMIEIPRAALMADKMAETAEFFSFGTNDLTQMGFGFSRDDIGSFLPDYLEGKLIKDDPFQTIDQEGIGQLIKYGVERGRSTKPNLKVGICGEHGGDPESVIFCHKIGMDYVSCSPFRVPIARLAAAHAAIESKKSVAPKEVVTTTVAAPPKKAPAPKKTTATKVVAVSTVAAPPKTAAAKKAASKKVAAKKK
jgi:pyruvate,orthophosphate dikinase